ncbi:MAG: AAA family ATPase, partial [Pseudomonadota bacterium]
MGSVKREISRIVLISGAPGAGKTTLAVPLAQELGFPLFSKDFLK